MRSVDAALAALLALGACRTGSTGPDAPVPGGPAAASEQAGDAPPTSAPAPTSAPTEAERAAVEAACKELGSLRPPKRCEATHYFDGFIIVKAHWAFAERDGAAWYLLLRLEGEYQLFQDAYIPPGGESELVLSPQSICDTDVPADGVPPAGTGIVRAEMRDLSLDGRDDLLVECRSDSTVGGRRTEGHYLQICVSSGPSYHGPIWLRRVESGHVEIDVDVKFVDGWVRRTERVYEEQGTRGDMQLSDPPRP